MNGTRTLVASVAATSSAAVAFINMRADKGKSGNSVWISTEVEKKNKYSPRFDGLRFIETLVTGHR